MSDQHFSYRHAAAGYAVHSTVNHLRKEYARQEIHINTADSFSAMLERVKWGVFHYMSRKHLARYLRARNNGIRCFNDLIFSNLKPDFFWL